MGVLGTETAFEVLARAKALEAAGRSIIHLEIGEPDFDTPEHIKEAAVRALRDGYTHYTPAAGLLEAREAIAEHVGALRGITVAPDEVVITPGAKPVMFFLVLALVNPGDEVIYPDPGFPIYESVARFVGARPVPWVLREERQFRADPEELRARLTPRTKLIILNSPHNPAASVLSRRDMEAVAEIVRGRPVTVLADEIYGRILYDGTFASLASIPEARAQTVILDGFSKTYAMTGWRLGYGVMQAGLAARITQLMVNSNSCTAAFTQMAGIAALRGPQDGVARMVAEFRRRRDVIVTGLNALPGVTCLRPPGAFYAFPNIRKIDSDAGHLQDYLLREAGVAVLAGTAFGAHGQGYLRLSYANSTEAISEALRRMTQAIARYAPQAKT
ncbi:MAG: pyridoxal phosphate-dependent aminotransferase [Bacillati bacterium ANGP1]|uniref:Aminotransferase n=1 Tax=Candidatus Segetimicrobium genomatis TaxID=2569760 RepID=A0A537JDW2_9BACT|nr:MAG: pyridoxal phosphate-dependent aminotransferase [Terrabacteria group bacterium ANGP1]